MTIAYFLVAITILVAIHEYGHFYVARRCGVKILRFSIGFGPRLYSWYDRHGTEFAISAIPLGGYVKMLDEREGDVPEHELEQAFNRKPVQQRIAIAAAGPIANFILAIALYWLVFMQGTATVAAIIGKVDVGSIADRAGLEAGQEIVSLDGHPVASRSDMLPLLINRLGESGEISFSVRYPNSTLVYESKAQLDEWLRDSAEPDIFQGLGIEFVGPQVSLVAAAVSEGSAAEKAGMQVGDRVISADGTRFADGQQWIDFIQAHPGRRLEVVVERASADGGLPQQVALNLTPATKEGEDGRAYGLAGISHQSLPLPEEMIRRHHWGVLGSAKQALLETGETARTVLVSLKKLVIGHLSTKNLSGPIGIAKVAGDSARAGVWAFVHFLAYISVLLGVFNLLPIPVLDGGHILYGLIEWVKGTPVSERVQLFAYQAGLAVLMGVMVLAFYNDILRL
jgi:site-2 protease. Metallo peptidase. MEROPS family M50B